jgi:hypothetical protein
VRRSPGVGPDQHIVVAAMQGTPCVTACIAAVGLAFCIAGDLVAQFGYHARLIGTVAQLVEQGPFKALVPGSSPGRPTIYL